MTLRQFDDRQSSKPRNEMKKKCLIKHKRASTNDKKSAMIQSKETKETSRLSYKVKIKKRKLKSSNERSDGHTSLQNKRPSHNQGMILKKNTIKYQ